MSHFRGGLETEWTGNKFQRDRVSKEGPKNGLVWGEGFKLRRLEDFFQDWVLGWLISKNLIFQERGEREGSTFQGLATIGGYGHRERVEPL